MSNDPDSINRRLVAVRLDEASIERGTPDQEHERAIAIYDLVEENRFGIPEPDVAPEACRSAAELSLLLVPLTGFDAAGNRLGMGGGWYDRSLAFRRERPAPPWLVGAAYATQCTEQIPVEPWDVRLDAICSEDATWIAEEPQ